MPSILSSVIKIRRPRTASPKTTSSSASDLKDHDKHPSEGDGAQQGWVACLDVQGQVVWWNHITGQSTYVHPSWLGQCDQHAFPSVPGMPQEAPAGDLQPAAYSMSRHDPQLAWMSGRHVVMGAGVPAPASRHGVYFVSPSAMSPAEAIVGAHGPRVWGTC